MPVGHGADYQHTLSDIRTKVRNRLLQATASTSTWTDAILNDLINQALDELKLHGIEDLAYNVFTTAADQQTWVPPPDVWKFVEINYDDTRLREITRDEMNAITGADWDAESGDWTRWFDDGTYIWFDKKASVGKVVKFWYWRRQPEMSVDTDLSGYAKVLSPVIVMKAVSLALESDGNGQEAAAWELRFDKLLPLAQMAVERLHESDVVQIRDHVGSAF